MFSKRFRCGKPLAGLAILFVLSGCSADRYLMVPKENLDKLNGSVQSQRATLVTMEGNAASRHEKLVDLNNTSTKSILEAIEQKIEKPKCPVVTAQACPPVRDQRDKGRADRLKGKVIVGELEKFYLAGPGLVYNARIDSGAETSSIDARNVTKFERDGNNWVRFDVPVPDSDQYVTMEKEVSRRVRIIQSSADEADRRVVVELQFAIGDHQQVAEFTLTDRQHLSHNVLIGRNVLRDVMLIDVGKEFSTKLPESLTKKNGDDS
ncbi:ATP-dependent zinc protease [Marinobacter sp. HN1S83]|uniref:ATP-dependent zinc protease family protein n=1 Tax=Marinobacter sp. HN1S83 TaxID=3382301 RepID=UPI00387B815B